MSVVMSEVMSAVRSVVMSAVMSWQAQTQIVEGHVTRPSAEAGGRPVPVARQWVVLHRVGSDHAAPLDSMRTDRSGRYRFRYSPSGDPDALYFVSARYGGIAYFSPPLRGATVRGGDADVIVYDTSTDTTTLRVQGRHLVVSAPRGAHREIAEIFELENQGTRTAIASDSVTPVWVAPLPSQAESASVAPGDLSAGAVVIRNKRAEVYAPIAPGVRQLVVTYLLPAKAFPWSVPLRRQVSVLEVLLEEPRASVEGARLAEVTAASIDGRMFRRFLAQDVPASAVMKVNAPPPIEQDRSAIRVLGIVTALAMLAAIGVWAARRRRTPTVQRATLGASDALIAELARLDARFEKEHATAEAQAAYEQQRAELKARIANAGRV